MIPLRLQVRNFLSYGENVPPLEFEGMHVVCLSGPNGHGKSALLDAITWALWGKSRARSDDDLIRHGQTQVMVDFEFLLDGQRYRVKRERLLRRKRGQSVLEFFIWNPERNAWRALTESSIRGTQARIVDVLRLDYETFLNSAYLRQGRADEFTVKTPGERKRILAEILRLDQYDALEKRARERMRAVEQEIAALQALMRTVEEEIAQRPQYERELAEAEALLARLEEELRTAEAREAQLQARREALKQVEADVHHQQVQVQRLEKEVRAAEEEMAALQARMDQARAHLATREQIEARYQALLEARQENERWGEMLRQQAQLQQKLQRAQEALNQARLQVEREVAGLRERVKDLQARAAQGEAARLAHAEARRQLEALAEVEAEIGRTRARLEAVQAERATLREMLRRLREEMDDLKVRIRQLEEARDQATCPLCGQPLTPDHVAAVVAELEAEGRRRGDAFRAGKEQLSQLESEQQALVARLQELERNLEQRARWQRAHAQAEQQLRQAEEAAQALQETEAHLQEAEKSLAEGTFAPELQAAVAEVQEDLVRLGYDAQAHEAVRARLEELAGAEAEYHEVQTAAERLQEYQARLAEVQKRRERWLETLAQEQARLAEKTAQLAELPEVEKEWRAQVAEVNRLAGQERDARSRMGAARQQLATCEAQEKRLKTLRRQLQEQEEARLIYQELAQAFGKNGLQAMIIEAVLPEIEQEANHLLARMTDGRMSVRLNTQRDLKSGGVAETLDIEIADGAGVRPYEMYSGGESFRINFALRVALSRLLARRAGARLQTLFIDEGFGSQDSEGRLRLVEAINAIQEDFALILVITHIEELKEAFPVRIEVFKGPGGSTYTVT